MALRTGLRRSEQYGLTWENVNLSRPVLIIPRSKSGQTRHSPDAQADVTSLPLGADIELDGAFVGSPPSEVGVTAGDHVITISKMGYKSWERKIKITSGEIAVAADLERSAATKPREK